MTDGLLMRRFTLFVFLVNKLIDTGKFDHITIDEVIDHAYEQNSLFGWLDSISEGIESFGDFTFEDRHHMAKMISSHMNACSAEKFLIEKRGLCYLIAIAVNIIQAETLRDEMYRD